jgi:ribonuclease Z
VTVLGTGCALPSRLRNVTGILVHLASGYVVLDPGEDFVGQLRRKYGRRNTESILAAVQVVWISHAHGDHYSGLYQLLYERVQVADRVIPVCLPDALIAECQMRQALLGDDFFKVSFLRLDSSVVAGTGFALKSVPVLHMEGSHGCLLTIDGKWKLAFSGDHSVHDGFVEGIQSCDLVIHEATYEDDMADLAEKSGHSTISQPIETGVQLSAKWTVLTHFSPRSSGSHLRVDGRNVIFAFDYLSFAFEDEAMQAASELGSRFFEVIAANSDQSTE